MKIACILTRNQHLRLTWFPFDTLWSRTGSCWCQMCQGNIRGAVFWPWPTKHFFASFNFIMKAWTATNSQIGTKPVWGPHPPLPLSTRPIPICHWPFPFNCASICMKTNVYNPPTPFIPSVEEERLGAYRWGQCLWMWPPNPAPHLPSLPHPPITDPTLHSIRCTLPWCWIFIWRAGGCLKIHMARWPWESEGGQYSCWQCDNGFRCFASWLAEKHIQIPLLWVMCRRSPSHEAGSTISLA